MIPLLRLSLKVLCLIVLPAAAGLKIDAVDVRRRIRSA